MMNERTERPLSASLEDYLETMLGLIHSTGAARVRDMAGHLNVAKSSVTMALRALSRRGLVNYKPYQMATLTESGQAAAERIRRRHRALNVFLRDLLDVEQEQAEATACRLEHVMGDAMTRRLSCFLEFMSATAVPTCDLPRAFREYCEQRRRHRDCEDCRADRPPEPIPGASSRDADRTPDSRP